jgi:hypothetical protein
VILGLLPPFILAFVWLSIHFARGSDPFFVGVPEEILRAGDRENTLALSSPKAKGVWAQVIATSVSVAQ